MLLLLGVGLVFGLLVGGGCLCVAGTGQLARRARHGRDIGLGREERRGGVLGVAVDRPGKDGVGDDDERLEIQEGETLIVSSTLPSLDVSSADGGTLIVARQLKS